MHPSEYEMHLNCSFDFLGLGFGNAYPWRILTPILVLVFKTKAMSSAREALQTNMTCLNIVL